MQNVKQLCFLLVLIVMGTLPMLADSPGPEPEPSSTYTLKLSESVPAAGEELGASLALRGTVAVAEWDEDFVLDESCFSDHGMGLVIEAGDLPRVSIDERGLELTVTEPSDEQVGTWEVSFDLSGTDLSAFAEVGSVTVLVYFGSMAHGSCYVFMNADPITFTYAP